MGDKKLYYSMGEVAEMFDVNQSLIRYWESKFSCLRPKKNKKGNRMFRPEDIEHFKMIYHLVKECGMTLEGAKRAMKQQGTDEVTRNAELLERLQSVRAMLIEVREILKDGGDAALLDDDLEEETDEEVVESKDGVKVAEIDEVEAVEVAADETEKAVELVEAEAVEATEEAPVEKKPRKKSVVEVIEPKPSRKRKKKDDDQRPLFAFYEQTLF